MAASALSSDDNLLLIENLQLKEKILKLEQDLADLKRSSSSSPSLPSSSLASSSPPPKADFLLEPVKQLNQLSNDHIMRYARQLLLTDFGVKGMQFH